MRDFSRRVGLLVGIAAMLVAAAMATAQTGAPPTSLRVPVPMLYFSGGAGAQAGTLAPENGTAGACGPTLTTATPAMGAMTTFSTADPPANGTYWLREGPIDVTLRFTGAPPAGSYATSGFRVNATLSLGNATLGTQTGTVAPGTTQDSADVPLAFPTVEMPEGVSGALQLEVRLISNTAVGAGPNNVALACGDGGSTIDEFVVYRGLPGDGDVDANGVPDSEDTDIDGDGFPNAAEAGIDCGTDEVRRFEFNPDLQPGVHDADSDGSTDEAECAAGSDPLSQFSFPPEPAGLPWGRIIFGVLLVALIAGGVFFFLVFGKAVSVSVVSASQLIIPKGGEGKYEVQVGNLRKKGNPINFQLSASGMPEGWDARLSADHAVLDPVGGAKNSEKVWLMVEAPEHDDAESAVIVVKAIALNAAGRKDTLKLPGRAKTITSINVPPNAKVPVKRGAPVKLQSEAAAVAAAEKATGAFSVAWREKDRPLIDVEGIGPTYAEKLQKAGIETLHQFYDADPKEVAKKTGAAAKTVEQWRSMVELIDVKGVGPQYAELLVRGGVSSVAELAASEPRALAEKLAEVSEGREVRIQGGPQGEKTVKHWVKAAKKHPLGKAAAPAPAEEPAKGTKAKAAPAAAAGGQPLQVGGLTHAPATFRQGEEVKSSVTVTNAGPEARKLKLSLFINDALADAQTIEVKPGKAKDVRFKWVAQEKNKLNIRGELVSG